MRTRLALFCLLIGACGDDGGGGTPDAAPGGGGAAPSISMVSWTTTGCTVGQASQYTIVTTATDSDTAAGMLTYSGSLSGCTPPSWNSGNSATEIITCPNAASYSGMVRVSDPEGNMDTQSFLVEPCSNGSAP